VSTPIFDLFADFVFFFIAFLAARHPNAPLRLLAPFFRPERLICRAGWRTH